jgi:hypothetical protein
MKTPAKSLFILFVSAGLFSCSRQIPISKVNPVNNKTYEVEFLFEHEGHKVYRFQDYGHYVYFTNCNGDVTNISSDTTEVHTINANRNNSKK